jgi:hypothetical protein
MIAALVRAEGIGASPASLARGFLPASASPGSGEHRAETDDASPIAVYYEDMISRSLTVGTATTRGVVAQSPRCLLRAHARHHCPIIGASKMDLWTAGGC